MTINPLMINVALMIGQHGAIAQQRLGVSLEIGRKAIPSLNVSALLRQDFSVWDVCHMTQKEGHKLTSDFSTQSET